ncbi:hypothetical protein GCM10010261_60390 [Streptomyces pilosus]|nr:hypothetical protein GCM10010261_60390 [Streptomyces pilosus]
MRLLQERGRWCAEGSRCHIPLTTPPTRDTRAAAVRPRRGPARAVTRRGDAGETGPPRPGAVPAGADPFDGERQLRDASASFQVADGRMTSAALAGSGW